jgi:hypothetical protein
MKRKMRMRMRRRSQKRKKKLKLKKRQKSKPNPNQQPLKPLESNTQKLNKSQKLKNDKALLKND